MKNIRKFETQADVSNWQMSEDHVEPNVVLVEDTRSILYNVKALSGVMIQHIDGSLYSKEQWSELGFSGSDANGIAVITDKIQVVVAKSSLGGCKWSSDTTNAVTGLPFAATAEEAVADYSGKDNTVLILSTDTSGAAYLCSNYQYPNGAKGYLASMGEWEEVYQYKAEVDEAMTIIGATTLGASGYWASTQQSGGRAWSKLWTDGSHSSTGKDNTRNARPFTSLTL